MESSAEWVVNEDELLACCGSTKFAKQMAALSPFSNLHHAIESATNIWFNQVDVYGWLEAFSAHPQIGQSPSLSHVGETFAQWSKGEQSTAMKSATSTTLQELTEWNARYKQKFGFVFLICASGRSTAEILAELKRRYSNRLVVELEIAAQEQMNITELRLAKLFSAKSSTDAATEFQPAAQEQMKITELRLAKLFSAKSSTDAATDFQPASVTAKANEDRLSMINSHLISSSDSSGENKSQAPKRNRPPITTHVLDMAGGHPGAGIEVQLEAWRGPEPRPSFPGSDPSGWTLVGSGKTDNDGRSNPLMNIVDAVNPGTYRISFNTGKYNPSGFFPLSL